MKVPAKVLVSVVAALAVVGGLLAWLLIPKRKPNILLISVDTLRADHLGTYGHRIATSPTIDVLADQGVRFADATVQWPKTWPSMASMLTGTFPTMTGIRHRPRRPLPPENVTLAEVLQEAGYQTGAVVANVNLGEQFAFDQGFGHFVESWMEEFREEHPKKKKFKNRAGKVKQFTNATLVTDQGLTFLDRTSDEQPFFLWLHYMDPHGPYVPPEEYEELFKGEYPSEPIEKRKFPRYQLQKDEANEPITDGAYYRTQYDREVKYLDDELSRLLDELDRRGLREDTIIVFTADHGESFTEHEYYFEHGGNAFQPDSQVPFVMVWDDNLPAGEVVEAPVGMVDLLPTLLKMIEVPVPQHMVGVDLMPLIRGDEREAPPYVFIEAGLHKRSQLAVRRGAWKLVHFRGNRDRKKYGPRWQLFDLSTDPGETKNVIEDNPEIVKELKKALKVYVATADVRKGLDDGKEMVLDKETQEMLRSLGYVR